MKFFRFLWPGLLVAALGGCSERELVPRHETGADATLGEDAARDATADRTPPVDSAFDEANDTAVEDTSDAALEDTSVFDAALEDTSAADTTVADTVPPAIVCVPAEDAGDASASDAESETEACAATRVRIVASNLTSGTNQNYEPAGIRILQALHPDVALMQEFRYPSGLRALVDEAFGPTFEFMVEPDPGNIPNGIVSRYPILESGEWDDPDLTDRDFVWARIDVPGPTDLWAVSVHLRTASPSARESGAKNLLGYVKTKVPAGAYLVIGGDLNTGVETEPALTVFSELLNVSSLAVDQAGSNKTNSTRSKPYDWVLPSPALFGRMIPVGFGGASFPNGLVFDTRVFAPPVAPALPTDSAATNMQHMAVVRDFALGG